MKKFNLNKLLVLSFIFSYSLILCRTLLVPSTDLNGRHFIRGDGFSDQNVYSTVLWVRDFGFSESAFRAVINYTGNGNKAEGQFYTHYPSWPDMVISAWSILIHSVSEPALRILPITLSLFLLYLIWQLSLIFKLSNDEKKLNLIFILLSGYFIVWADSLHKHLWENIINFMFAIGLWKYYSANLGASSKIQNKFISTKLKWLLLFVPMSFLATQASFETYVTVATMVIGMSMVFESGLRKVLNGLNIYLGILFISGFVFHLSLNSIALGSFLNAIADLTTAFSYRTAGVAAEATQMTWLKKIELLWLYINRQERYYLFPGPVLLMFLFWFYKYKLQDQKLKGFLLVLFFASFTWYLAMPQHAYVHHFTAKHSGLWVSLICASGLKELIQRMHLSILSWQTRVWYKLVATYAFLMALSQIVLSVWWQYSLKYLAENKW
jgi:hypothetical protein